MVLQPESGSVSEEYGPFASTSSTDNLNAKLARRVQISDDGVTFGMIGFAAGNTCLDRQ